MSTIRANSITNSAGTGAPDFPNGITAATIPAANLTGTLPAIDGSALTNLPAPTTNQVGSATAGLAAGAVGSYMFATSTTASDAGFGATQAGSSLIPTSAMAGASGSFGGFSFVDGAAQSGTWMAMGFLDISVNFPSSGAANGGTLFLRIS